MNWFLENGKSVKMEKAVYQTRIDGCIVGGKRFIELSIEIAKKKFISRFLENTHANIYDVKFKWGKLTASEIFEETEEYKVKDRRGVEFYILHGKVQWNREVIEKYVKRDVKRLVAVFHYVAPQSGGV